MNYLRLRRVCLCLRVCLCECLRLRRAYLPPHIIVVRELGAGAVLPCDPVVAFVLTICLAAVKGFNFGTEELILHYLQRKLYKDNRYYGFVSYINLDNMYSFCNKRSLCIYVF